MKDQRCAKAQSSRIFSAAIYPYCWLPPPPRVSLLLAAFVATVYSVHTLYPYSIARAVRVACTLKRMSAKELPNREAHRGGAGNCKDPLWWTLDERACEPLTISALLTNRRAVATRQNAVAKE